ncbi:uncharacterized protein LOC106088721 isoform X2 [Stomoxys calcitrans]|nr:uncharacterized protein LOC106088721 isoform X2 [Stomoxys calcitrans]XP_013109830.1 uncharacterized protein LOC106088721 isoform X2 [Stomoxys calcitrans]
MLKVGFMVDCKFIVGPNPEKAEIIFGHKWMFAVESPVFERMFCGDFMEAKNSTEIRLPDDDPNAFRNLRRLLYYIREARVDALNLEDTIGLYKLCDKYMFASIIKLCSEHLQNFLVDIDDAGLIIIFAAAIELRNEPLLEGVKEKLKSRLYPLIAEINELNKIHFMEYTQLYIETNSENTDHLALFNAIEKYLTQHNLIPQPLKEAGHYPVISKALFGQEAVALISEERKPELLERLIACVDFAKISTENFLAGPGISKLLTWQQKYFILSQLCSGEPKPSTIKLFQNITEPNTI